MRLAFAVLASSLGCAGSSPPSTGAGDGAPRVSLDGISVVVPSSWNSTTPSSEMRKAQWSIADDTELVVYYFDGGGGSVEDNLERWYGQFVQDDGSSTSATASLATRTIAGMRVTTVDVSGRYVAETQPGSGQHVDHPGYRMLAAIVMAPGGGYYFKLIGPSGHVRAALAHFGSMIDSVQPE